MSFNEKPIYFGDFDDGEIEDYKKILPCDMKYYSECRPGDSIASVHPKGNRFNSIKLSKFKVCNTMAAGSCLFHYKQPRQLTTRELNLISSFPVDYNYVDIEPKYLMGMSVPPVMMAQVANQVYNQWLSKIVDKPQINTNI